VSGPTIAVLGVRLRPLERIEATGAALGLSRSASYRESEHWPLTGRPTSKRVVVPRLLDDLGIPYVVENEEVTC
jgi:hypothetical protein